jgi:hypothetical protein
MRLLIVFALTVAGGILAQRPTGKAPFTLVLSTEDPTVTIGSDIWVKLQWTNTSDRAIDSSANILDATNVDPNFLFKLIDANGHSLPVKVYKFPQTFGHAVFGTLEPGETITRDINIVRLYDIKKAGKYTLQVSRRAPQELGGGLVKSNRITITIERSK